MEENRRAKAAKEDQDEVRFHIFLIYRVVFLTGLSEK